MGSEHKPEELSRIPSKDPVSVPLYTTLIEKFVDVSLQKRDQILTPPRKRIYIDPFTGLETTKRLDDPTYGV